MHASVCIYLQLPHPVRLSYSAESTAIQQYFSLTTNQRTVFSATINQRNDVLETFSSSKLVSVDANEYHPPNCYKSSAY
jgi:hypothetical protein